MPDRRVFIFWCYVLLLPFTPPAGAEVRIDLVGHWGGSVHAVDMGGSYAYVGVGPRLVVLDLSNPSAPRRIGQTPPLGHIPTAITLYQSRCYVGLITGTLSIVDVSDPAQPLPVGSCQLGNRVIDIAVQEGLAIVSTESAGIYVIDVASPAQPTVLYNLNNPYWPGGSVSIRGRYAYCIEDGLRVLDLIDPTHPITLGVNQDVYGWLEPVYFPEFDELWGIIVGESGIEAIWLDDPWIAYPPMFAGNYSGSSSKFVVEGSLLYIGGTFIYEENSPLHYIYQGIAPPRRTTGSLDFAARNGIVCTTDGYEGLQIVDARDPAQQELLSYYDESNHSLHVSASDGLAFVSGYRHGVQVLDVSDPSSARRIAEWEGPFTFRVRVRDALAVVADADGLKTMDISDIGNPRLLATLQMDEVPVDLVLDGRYAYVANLAAGLTIVDVAEATAPRTVARLDPGSAVGIAKRGDLVYLAMGEQGLQIIDVTNPPEPILLGSIVTPGQAYSVAVLQETAFVASLGGISVVDCSDVMAPRFVTRLPGDSQWQTIEAEGDRVYVATFPGLRVFDASNPLEPRMIGRHTSQGWTQGLAYADGLVYLATNSGGLEILTVRDLGDLDGDGTVGLFDLTTLLSSFGTCAGDSAYNRYGDLDGDECVGVQDLASLLAAFGE